VSCDTQILHVKRLQINSPHFSLEKSIQSVVSSNSQETVMVKLERRVAVLESYLVTTVANICKMCFTFINNVLLEKSPRTIGYLAGAGGEHADCTDQRGFDTEKGPRGDNHVQ